MMSDASFNGGGAGAQSSRGIRVGFRAGPYPELSETFVASQIANMAARGHVVSVLADEVRGFDHSLPITRRVASTRPRLAPFGTIQERLPWRLRNAWKSAIERRWARRTDVVVCNFGWFGAKFARSFRGRRRAPPFVTIFHGADVSRSTIEGGDRIYDELFAKCDLMLAVSDLWRSRLVALGAPPERVRVLRMGVDLTRHYFDPRPPDQPVRRLLHVGRLVEKKGTEVLLHAFALARQGMRDMPMMLEIIGTGPLEQRLKRTAETLGLADSVRFLGARSHQDVCARLTEADLFVLPSVTAADGDMEGIPVALMEAMATGVPVISSNHSGIPELIEHGESGLLARERDPQDLSRQIHVAVTDAQARKGMAERARETIEQRFDQAHLYDKLEAILLDLAGDARRKQSSQW